MKIRQPIPISSETLNPDCRPAGRCEPDNPSSYLLFCISPYAYSIWMSEIILKEKKIEILFIYEGVVNRGGEKKKRKF